MTFQGYLWGMFFMVSEGEKNLLRREARHIIIIMFSSETRTPVDS